MDELFGSYIGGIADTEYTEIADDDLVGLGNDRDERRARDLQALRTTYNEMERVHAHHFGVQPLYWGDPAAPQGSTGRAASGPQAISPTAQQAIALINRANEQLTLQARQREEMQRRQLELQREIAAQRPVTVATPGEPVSIEIDKKRDQTVPMILAVAAAGVALLILLRK